MISTEPTLTLAEAAQRLHCSAKTVRQRIKRGEIRAHLVEGLHGPEYRVPAAALETVGGADSFSPRAGQGTLENGRGRVGNGTLEADSSRLNPQAQRAGQGTLNGTLEGGAGQDFPRMRDNSGHHHRADLAEQKASLLESELVHLRAQLEVRARELERRDHAEAELRRLLLTSQQLAHELALQLEQKALPPAPDTQPTAPQRVRWWAPWRRR